MLVAFQFYGRATFRLVVCLGFDAIVKLISPSGFEYRIGYFNVEALCCDLVLRPFGSV